jgi:hypothetical protein
MALSSIDKALAVRTVRGLMDTGTTERSFRAACALANQKPANILRWERQQHTAALNIGKPVGRPAKCLL